MNQKITAKQAILNRLASCPGPIPIHELNIVGYSDNALATRMSELAAAGEVVSEKDNEHPHVKLWRLATAEEKARLTDLVNPGRKPLVRGRILASSDGERGLFDHDEVYLIVAVPKHKWRGGPARIDL